jgi:hypothetical protein
MRLVTNSGRAHGKDLASRDLRFDSVGSYRRLEHARYRENPFVVLTGKDSHGDQFNTRYVLK